MSRKQAVLLIHGIGEQRPMDTLRDFVETVWTTNDAVHNAFAGSTVWSKPDGVSESFELRRLTTAQSGEGVRTDFFEFYWAHLLTGTTVGHLWGWARTLLWRLPRTVPKQLKSAYWILWLAVFATSAQLLYAAAHTSPESWGSAILSVAVLPLINWVLTKIVGDAARYLHVAPPNIQSRHAIRQAGVKLLETLHDRKYDRIVIVGHSLGSVIAYDILTYAWARYNAGTDTDGPRTEALDRLENLAASGADTSLEEIRTAQKDLSDERRQNGDVWRVTDLVTLGSPLAHADILLATDGKNLERKQRDRELPTSPPEMEVISRGGQSARRFSYFASPGSPRRVLHHAAPFGMTRWTNLYFPCKALIFGDVIGGPVADHFGHWVADVEVVSQQRCGLFLHTNYWDRRGVANDAMHLTAIRRAVYL